MNETTDIPFRDIFSKVPVRQANGNFDIGTTTNIAAQWSFYSASTVNEPHV